MATASGILTSMSYVAEVTHGVTPGSPTMKALRCNGRNINLKKNAITSQEVRADRQTSDVRHGFARVEGAIPLELCSQAHDDMVAAAMGGAWTAGTSVASIAAVASGGKFTRASGSFITAGYRKGDIVITAGFATSANNGTWLVTAVVALELTVVAYSGSNVPADEASEVGQTVNLVGKRVDVGTTLTTFTFERGYSDIAKYETFLGCAINRFGLSIKPEGIVTANMDLLGMSAPPSSGTSLGSPTAAAATSPFSAQQAVIREGGSTIAVCTGVEFDINNSRTVEGVVGASTSPDVFEGINEVTGRVTAFLPDLSLLEKFRAETETSLWVRLVDPTDPTQFMSIIIPRLKYTDGAIDPPRSGAIPLVLPFSALVDSVSGTTLSFQRSNS